MHIQKLSYRLDGEKGNDMYIMKIQAKGTGEIASLYVFEPIKAGTEIGWGADETQPNKIKKWNVVSCLEEVTALDVFEPIETETEIERK